ncbi:hypothetical protein AB1Y20_003700 [Prymnesium parvum]|uniref:Hexosyltransferase n=1 Tax=Prymnesium parvum TaxID=97485 RepID=A0AB34J7S7_PRYPA
MHGGAAARRLDGALDKPSRRLAARGEACVRAYDAWEQQRLRHGYWDEARLARLSAQLDPQTLLLPPRATPEAPRVALLVSGQAYRGRAREAASYSTHTLREPIASRRRAQALAAASLMAKVVLPFEAAGHHVDLFLTLYNTLPPSHREELLSFYRGRVKAITTVRERGSSQLVTLAQSLKTFLDLCAANHLHYEAVIVTRFDLYLKQSIPALLGGDARAVDGFRFLWRESSGHWRHSARGRALTFRRALPYAQLLPAALRQDARCGAAGVAAQASTGGCTSSVCLIR